MEDIVQIVREAAPPLDSTDQAAALREAKRLYRLGRCAEAIAAARSVSAQAEESPEAELLVVRCLTDQGRFNEAASVCRVLIASPSPAGEWWREAGLRLAWLELFLTGDPEAIFREGRSALETKPEATESRRTLAWAQFLLGCSIAVAVEWRLAPAGEMEQARSLAAASAQSFREMGEFDETLNASLRLGQFYLMGTSPDRASARAVFAEVRGQAEAAGDVVCQARAMLWLAELEWDEAIQQRVAGEAASADRAGFEQAIALYEVAGHALGVADASLSLGTRLNEAGEDGAPWLERAIETYQRLDNLPGLSRAYSAQAIWRTRQGALDEAVAAHQEAIRVAQAMGFPSAEASARLGLGDYYYRRGEFARALAEFETTERLAGSPMLKALRQVNLANLYFQMNLRERARDACREAIATFRQFDALDSLSLAYLVLGNVTSGMGDWAGAITVWREGASVDEARGDPRAQAEKLLCIAQATVMQHCRGPGQAIPQPACDEAISLYEKARKLISGFTDQQAVALVANSFQMQAQTASTCGQLADAVKCLEQARAAYAGLGWQMQAAVTDSLLGLVCMEAGRLLSPEYYAEAEERHRRALDYFERAGMRDQCWLAKYYLADTAYRRGFYAADAETRNRHWKSAAGFIEQAAADIELIRGGYVEPDAESNLATRVSLVSNKEKIYVFAIQLHAFYRNDPTSALEWVERLKGRAFLDALALQPLSAPPSLDRALLEQETELLDHLRRGANRATALALSQELQAVWDEMGQDAAAAEYVALRRGEPASWNDLLCSLPLN